MGVGDGAGEGKEVGDGVGLGVGEGDGFGVGRTCFKHQYIVCILGIECNNYKERAHKTETPESKQVCIEST